MKLAKYNTNNFIGANRSKLIIILGIIYMTARAQNTLITKFLNTRINEIDNRTNTKPYVIIMYSTVDFPEIEHVINFAGGVDQVITYTTQPEFVRNLEIIRDTYPTKQIALMAGMSTEEAFLAQDTIGPDRPNIHLMSGWSTYPSSDLRVLHASYTDELFGPIIILFAKLYDRTKNSYCL